MWIWMFHQGCPEKNQLDFIVPILPLEVGAPAHDFSWGSGSLLSGGGCSCSLAPRSLGATQLVSQATAIKSERMLWNLSTQIQWRPKRKCPPGGTKSR